MVDYQRIMKMELDFTSKTIGPKTFDSYTAELFRGNMIEIKKLIKLLLPELWEREIKDKELLYKSYKTIDHLIFVDNDEVYYFLKCQ